MRCLSVLVLLGCLAAVSLGRPAPPEPTKPADPVVKVALHESAVTQITSSTSWPVVLEAPAPVSTLESGLTQVRKFSKPPIVAMAETKDWFFYATCAGGAKDGRPDWFISGYLIKRDGRQFTSFSIW